MKLGLQVGSDGTLLLAGKPFWAFGENNYGTYARWTEDDSKDWFRQAIPALKAYNVPFIRCPFSGFGPDYYDKFDANPEKYFAMMDEVIRCAEKNRMGLIVSLMWMETAIPTHVGEHRSAFGDPDSKTHRYAKEYVTNIVKRYTNSPAVWGWEVGNEYNLAADLCDPACEKWMPDAWCRVGAPSTFDYYTVTELRCFYAAIARTIRAIDPDRMISDGNGEMRDFAYSSYLASSQKMDPKTHIWPMEWKKNSRNGFQFMCDYLTPAPMDTLSFHFQHATLNDPNPQYILDYIPLDDGVQVDLTGYIRLYVEACRALGKACYFGEYGDLMDMDTIHAPDRREKYQYVMDCIKAAGVQLASSWHYQDYTDEGFNGDNLRSISRMNTLYQDEGKQDTDAYWNAVLS